MDVPFRDRSQAASLLAGRLEDLADDDVVVLALPRGGVPVGVELAERLDADLDVLVVKKVGVPGQEELALGAVGANGTLVINEQVAAVTGVSRTALRQRAETVAAALAGRADEMRGGRPAKDVRGRVAVVVDDGIATGATMLAALAIVRSAGPDRLIAAVPVAPPDACRAMGAVADRVECLRQPEPFGAVGHWYHNFDQLTDDDVRRLLDGFYARHPAHQL